VGSGDSAQQRLADTGAADTDQADLLVRAVAQPVAQFLSSLEQFGVKPRDVADEIEVVLRPVAHGRQVRSEPVGHDVVRIADKQCLVPEPRETPDLLDHLCVVVRR
jgi:hypothetical protein